jgi:hypothetical protein
MRTESVPEQSAKPQYEVADLSTLAPNPADWLPLVNTSPPQMEGTSTTTRVETWLEAAIGHAAKLNVHLWSASYARRPRLGARTRGIHKPATTTGTPFSPGSAPKSTNSAFFLQYSEKAFRQTIWQTSKQTCSSTMRLAPRRTFYFS